MRRFYAHADQVFEEEILLDEEESKHLSRVLRLQIGDKVEAVDGLGNLYQAQVSEISKRNCRLQINQKQSTKTDPPGLWMAVAPTKNLNRWEWFLEKATELGIGRISPILCRRSERKVLKIDRQMRILKEAMKQSQRLYLPELNELSELSFIIDEAKDFSGEKFIAHCEDAPKELLKSLHQSGKKALILIGPEGDFHPDEISKALENGFKAISLGDSRLRTETAALAACHTVNLINA
jgi:16S rRNA (uracil1498-N3)-methyltransferase